MCVHADEKPVVPFDICGIERKSGGGGTDFFDTRSDLFLTL